MAPKAAYVECFKSVTYKVKQFLLNCNNQLHQTNSYWQLPHVTSDLQKLCTGLLIADFTPNKYYTFIENFLAVKQLTRLGTEP